MSTEMDNLGWSFSLILLLMLCIYPTEEISVTFERQVSSYVGGSSFYSSTDYFDSIGSSDQNRQQFCSKLNAICTRSSCLRCRCVNKQDTFISYSIGCRNDYFKGKRSYSPFPSLFYSGSSVQKNLYNMYLRNINKFEIFSFMIFLISYINSWLKKINKRRLSGSFPCFFNFS